jgi:hypothetical protein
MTSTIKLARTDRLSIMASLPVHQIRQFCGKNLAPTIADKLIMSNNTWLGSEKIKSIRIEFPLGYRSSAPTRLWGLCSCGDLAVRACS